MSIAVPARVCAIVGSYQPDLEVLRSVVEAVQQQVHKDVIVDNGSPGETVSKVRALVSETGIELVQCSRNLGVATGHNLGIGWARREVNRSCAASSSATMPKGRTGPYGAVDPIS